MISATPVCFALIVLVTQAQCGDYIPKRKCAVLFSDSDFSGDKFDLWDFGFSANLQNEYRHSSKGWQKTGSIFVEDGCKLRVCDKAYFLGNCHHFVSSNETQFGYLVSSAQSVSCTCKRKCICKQVQIEKDLIMQPKYGRVFLKDECDACETTSVEIVYMENSPIWHNMKVEALTLRSGCSITIFPEVDFEGLPKVIQGPVHQGLLDVKSYQVSCSDDDYKELIVPRLVTAANISYPSHHVDSQIPSYDATIEQDMFESVFQDTQMAHYSMEQIADDDISVAGIRLKRDASADECAKESLCKELTKKVAELEAELAEARKQRLEVWENIETTIWKKMTSNWISMFK